MSVVFEEVVQKVVPEPRRPQGGEPRTQNGVPSRRSSGKAKVLSIYDASDASPARGETPSSGLACQYAPLLQLLQSCIRMQAMGLAIGLTSSRPGEGVTHIAHELADNLALYAGEDVLVISSASLFRLAGERHIDFDTMLTSAGDADVLVLRGGPISGLLRWWADVDALVCKLRQRFCYIVIDCEALDVSLCAIRVADVAQAMLLVVAVGTHTAEVESKAALLAASRAGLTGCVLNKYVSHVPRWLRIWS
jgi:hypothetical protein